MKLRIDNAGAMGLAARVRLGKEVGSLVKTANLYCSHVAF